MIKVYVMTGIGMDNEKHVLAVFSSKKKADEAVAWILSVDTWFAKYPEKLRISVFELNGEEIPVKE